MAKFSEVLRNRDFFLLWLGQIISQLGDRLDQMALIAFVYQRSPGSAMEIAKILSFTIIPVFLIGPLAGVYVDRWDRRRTMYVCDILRAALVLTIPLFLFYSKNLTSIYLIIFIVFSIGRFFVPAKLSIVPDLVQKKDILLANSLVNTTGMIAAILGFGVSGILVQWLGPRVGFYLDSFSFFISALLIFFISKKTAALLRSAKAEQGLVAVIRKSVLQEIKDGIKYFVKNKEIRFTAAITFVLWSALGAVYVVLIVFVQRTLQSATSDLGLLVMFLGLGLFLGSLVYGRFGQMFSQYTIIFVSLFCSGIMLVIFALILNQYPNFPVAAVLSCAFGMIVSPIMIASNTIVHNASESAMRGKIFSSLEIIMHLGFILFMFISSLLAESISRVTILVVVGCVVAFLGVISFCCQSKIHV